MGRLLKRVPLDFSYPLEKVWEGYAPELKQLKKNKELIKRVPELLEYQGNICKECDKYFNNCSESARYCVWYNEELKDLWFKEVPQGEGYQLWENTTEGSPQSPVFKKLEDLCEWCETNAYTFADMQTTKEEWYRMLSKDDVQITTENNGINITWI
jgi:hypothetical protein